MKNPEALLGFDGRDRAHRPDLEKLKKWDETNISIQQRGRGRIKGKGIRYTAYWAGDNHIRAHDKYEDGVKNLKTLLESDIETQIRKLGKAAELIWKTAYSNVIQQIHDGRRDSLRTNDILSKMDPSFGGDHSDLLNASDWVGKLKGK